MTASPGTTDAVPEGSVNLYFTDARAAAAAPVQSVAGKTGAVSLTKSDVGLANVDNTSDLNKPISTATQSALDLKAPLASPALTGFPTAPTAAPGTGTTQIATTAFVAAAVASGGSYEEAPQDGGYYGRVMPPGAHVAPLSLASLQRRSARTHARARGCRHQHRDDRLCGGGDRGSRHRPR